ncbi:AAA family ATPase [Rahnella victoriana]|uniref:AAA family ATPase n=1 Tax=Rahnella victoriana TaxID=1510570 RepID=UPI001E3FD229|nr:ATP-binding protein [Rahnella victoriana]UHM90807.1 ATP-binding protein [Rahnella victoriana]
MPTDRLTKSIQPDVFSQAHNRIKPTDNSKVKELIYEITPERRLESLVLSQSITTQLEEVIEEQHRSELLKAHNISPRNKIMLAGAPGNGKTTLAEALASELMYPLLIVRYETLVGSYLGETSNRLKTILDYARTQRCVLFFDEFETLGKERGDTHETGEIKRVVSSLLLQLDNLPDYVVVVAASNHPELLDRAVWRRFQVRIDIPMPTREQLKIFISDISIKSGINFGYAPESLAKFLLGSNFSDTQEFCLSIMRRAILDRSTKNAKSITKTKMEQWKNRLAPLVEKTNFNKDEING